MLVIGLVASAIGIAVGLLISWFPVAGSTQAKHVDMVWYVLIVASVPLFVIVEVVVFYCVIVFRVRPGEEHLEGPPIHGNTRLEIMWTAAPAALLAGLCIYAFIALTHLEKSASNALPVRVVAEQFAFTFYYPNGKGGEFASNQLYLPTNRAVKFSVQSKDVIHDFWAPVFRVKIDAVPGITTHLHVTTTDKVGHYDVTCNELCGVGHSTMRAALHIVTPAAFDKWMHQQIAPKPSGPPGAPNAATLFTTTAQPTPCATCHTLKAVGATGTIGPDLDQGLKGKSKAFIRQCITNPNSVVPPGYQPNIMPQNFAQTLSPAELDALVNFLEKVTNK